MPAAQISNHLEKVFSVPGARETSILHRGWAPNGAREDTTAISYAKAQRGYSREEEGASR